MKYWLGNETMQVGHYYSNAVHLIGEGLSSFETNCRKEDTSSSNGNDKELRFETWGKHTSSWTHKPSI